MSVKDNPLKGIAKAILAGNGNLAVEAAGRAVEANFSMDDIVMKGILKAWVDFAEWHDRDPIGSLKMWLECYNTTNKVLKLLDSKIAPPPNPPFSILVVCVRGEGHVIMRDIIALMLKSKGLKVFSSKKGVLVGDISEPLSDRSLKFVILSCIEEATKATLSAFVKGVRAARPDVKIVAGGPIAGYAGADVVLSDPSKLFDTLMDLYNKM